jgi:hypothetical protein
VGLKEQKYIETRKGHTERVKETRGDLVRALRVCFIPTPHYREVI